MWSFFALIGTEKLHTSNYVSCEGDFSPVLSYLEKIPL